MHVFPRMSSVFVNCDFCLRLWVTSNQGWMLKKMTSCLPPPVNINPVGMYRSPSPSLRSCLPEQSFWLHSLSWWYPRKHPMCWLASICGYNCFVFISTFWPSFYYIWCLWLDSGGSSLSVMCVNKVLKHQVLDFKHPFVFSTLLAFVTEWVWWWVMSLSCAKPRGSSAGPRVSNSE